jgi:hypothetical protein
VPLRVLDYMHDPAVAWNEPRVLATGCYIGRDVESRLGQLQAEMLAAEEFRTSVQPA